MLENRIFIIQQETSQEQNSEEYFALFFFSFFSLSFATLSFQSCPCTLLVYSSKSCLRCVFLLWCFAFLNCSRCGEYNILPSTPLVVLFAPSSQFYFFLFCLTILCQLFDILLIRSSRYKQINWREALLYEQEQLNAWGNLFLIAGGTIWPLWHLSFEQLIGGWYGVLYFYEALAWAV